MKTSQRVVKIDVLVAMAGILVSSIAAIYLLVQGGRYILILAACVTLFSCGCWLFVRNKVQPTTAWDVHGSTITRVLGLLYLVFLLLAIMAYLSRESTYSTPLTFMILVSMMAGIVSLEALFSQLTKLRLLLIMCQIVAIGLLLELSHQMLFPSVLGIDTWWHERFTERLVESAHIPEGTSYSVLPIFHIDVGVTSVVAGIGYKLSTMISISLVQIIVNTFLIFLLGRSLFNDRVGILSALMLMTANHHLNMGIMPIPNTLAVVLILLVLYSLIALPRNLRYESRTVVIVLFVTIILTHSLASAALVLIIVTGWTTIHLARKGMKDAPENPVSARLGILFSISMVGWWVLCASFLVARLLELMWYGFDASLFARAPSEIRAYASGGVPLAEQILNNSGFYAFFGFAILGSLYMLSKRMEHARLVLSVVGLVILAVSYLSIIGGRGIIEHRWWYVAQILLSLPFATALVLLANLFKKNNWRTLFVFATTTLVAFTMITSPAANIDNRTLSPNSGIRYALTEAEIRTIDMVETVVIGTIGTDQYYAATQVDSNVSFQSIDNEILSGNFTFLNCRVILIRDEISKNPFLLEFGLWKLDYSIEDALYEREISKIIDTGTVAGYAG